MNKHYTWNELEQIVNSSENCTIHLKPWIVIPNLHVWMAKQSDLMDYLIKTHAQDISKNKTALERKKTLIEVVKAIEEKRILPLGTCVKSEFSIYPIKIN